MNKSFKVSGMTCQGCVASVRDGLLQLEEVNEVSIDLASGEVEMELNKNANLDVLQKAIPQKYQIVDESLSIEAEIDQKSKWQQLQPLFLIFAYLFVASILLNYQDWNTQEAMLDFMGLFYIVFSFFKFLDLKGFPESFRMYDPLAKAVPVYGWIYPFLELALGLLFLMRFQIMFALIVTIVILGITTIGVTKSLLNKKAIRCACLGTALQLPMTEATFIENAIMLVMAIGMIVQMI